jgi:hypothetical protein
VEVEKGWWVKRVEEEKREGGVLKKKEGRVCVGSSG